MNKEGIVKVDNCVINEKDLESLKDLLKNGFTFRKNINEVLLKVISYFEKYNDEKVMKKMNKEKRVKLVFEAISKIAGFEIKPDKEFYRVEYGLKYTYKIDENLNIFYKTAAGEYKESLFNITTFFNTVSQIEEIQEPLLTDEEKDFLRHFEFEALAISSTNLLYIYGKNKLLIATLDLDIVNLSFDGLKVNRKYSREELGL